MACSIVIPRPANTDSIFRNDSSVGLTPRPAFATAAFFVWISVSSSADASVNPALSRDWYSSFEARSDISSPYSVMLMGTCSPFDSIANTSLPLASVWIAFLRVSDPLLINAAFSASGSGGLLGSKIPSRSSNNEVFGTWLSVCSSALI